MADEIPFYKHSKSAASWSPEQAMASVLDAVKSGRRRADSIVMVIIDEGESGDEYNIQVVTAGLRYSETIAALEIGKNNVFQQWRER